MGGVWVETRKSGLVRLNNIWLFLALLGCQTTPSSPTKISFTEAHSNPEQFRGETVKACGFASFGYENNKITKSRSRNRHDSSNGLSVHWLESEPRRDGTERRCVTGLLEPICGWHEFEARTDDIWCFKTGHTYNFQIRLTTLARD